MPINWNDLFKKALKDERKILRPYFFPAEGAGQVSLIAEEAYLRLRLSRMFLKDRRVLFQTKYPVVNTSARFVGPGGRVEMQYVAQPELAGDANKSRLDDVVALDKTVLGPVLYKGGDMELMLGLYAAPADDWAKRFIKLAEGISQLTPFVPLTTAVSMAGALKSSLEDSLAGDGLDLKLGLDMELKENVTLAPGHLVMIAAPDSEINRDALRMVDGELLTADGKIYADHDYMVLAIESTERRSDWQTMGYDGAWKKLLSTAADADDIALVKAAYLTFVSIIQSSDDLSLSDKSGIVALAQERITALRNARSNVDFLDDLKDLGDLSAIDDLINADATLPVDAVRRLTADEMMATGWLD